MLKFVVITCWIIFQHWILHHNSNATPCNSFPKFIGADTGDTQLRQFDAFGDYLVLVGDTTETKLTGTSSQLPYIALISIQTAVKYFWTKVFSSKTSQSLYGVQFSTDGALIIAHSFSTSPFIVVFNTETGLILSVRAYSSTSFQNYDKTLKSMLISSGPSPMAYILSNQKGTATQSSWTGQNLLKFDPLNFNVNPTWAKKTIISPGAAPADSGHLGLVFGRTEQLLYSYSWYNSKCTISMVDSNGNSQWQYSVTGGSRIYNNFIQYENIDASTDLIVASSGSPQISYHRILASSATPYSVQAGSLTYKDPTSDSQRELRALRITDLTTSKSLIYDVANFWTDIATINFSTLKITYQRTFPLIKGMTTGGIFVSDNLYYVGSTHTNFYQTISTTPLQLFNTLSWYQSIVYSSDQTLSSCYTMPTEAAQSPLTLTTSAISSIGSAIYQASTMTFVADAAASTTVDMIISMVTQVAWCPQTQAFTVNPVTQTTSTFSFNALTAIQNLAITPFSASVNCGTLANSWSYSGIDTSDGAVLDQGTKLISINPSSGQITVALSKPAGTYNIKIIGTLPDLTTSTFALFTITVLPATNNPPFFVSALTDITVPLKTIVSYQFPAITDSDTGDVVTLSLIKDSVSGSIPVFMTLVSGGSPSLTIAPTLMSQVKAYTIIVEITDTKSTVPNQFILTVTNLAPIVTSTIPTSVSATFGVDFTYNLPISKDPEDLTFVTTLQSGPSYVSLLSSTQLKIFPVNCGTDFGTQTVSIKLEDQEPKSFVYSFNIIVGNLAPTFTGSLPQPQLVSLNSALIYILPSFSDPEGCSVLVSFQPSSLIFITVSTNQLIFAPSLYSEIGVHSVTVYLTDNKGLYSNAIFTVTVTNLAPQITQTVPTEVLVSFGSTQLYTLPTAIDPEGLPFATTISSGPQFVTLISSTQISMNPLNCNTDLGSFTLSIKLEDGQPKSFIYSFTIKVPNQPPAYTGILPQPQTLFLLTTLSYPLPPFADPEGCAVSISLQPVSLQSSFISISGTSLFFAPTLPSHTGNFAVAVVLADPQGLKSTSTFILTVQTLAPTFTGTIPLNIDLMASTLAHYYLPVVVGIPNEYIKHQMKLPRFVSLKYPKYSFMPDEREDLGVHLIQGELWNSFSSISFSFTLNVTNEAPQFQGRLKQKLAVALNTNQKYLLPHAIDREHQPISIVVKESRMEYLPVFVKFNETIRTLIFQPTSLQALKIYTLKIDLIDIFDAKTPYYLNIQIYDPLIFQGKKQPLLNDNSNNLLNQNSRNSSNSIKGLEIFQLKIVVIKVTRDSQAILKIINPERNEKGNTQEIVKLISASSFKVYVRKGENDLQISFQIKSKNIENSEIELFLMFPDPRIFSLSQIPDQLKIVVSSKIQVFQDLRLTLLPENQISFADIPAQFTEVFEYKFAKFIQKGRLVITQISALDIFIGVIIQLVWYQLEDLSFLTINSIISISIPSLPQKIQSALIKLIYFDILYLEFWLPQAMTKIGLNPNTVHNDEAINLWFSEQGYDSKQFIKNAGSTFIFLIVFVLAWFTLFILTLISVFSSCTLYLKIKLRYHLMWDQSLNFIFSQFSPLIMCSLINLFDMRFLKIEKVSIVSAFIVIVTLFFSLIALAWIMKLACREAKEMKEESVQEFISKYPKLFEDLKYSKTSRLIVLWKPLFLLRQLLTYIILITMKSYPAIQIALLLIISFLQQCFILKARPYEKWGANFIAFVNEFAVSISLYLMFLLTDHTETQINPSHDDQKQLDVAKYRIYIAWILAVLLLFTILINFFFSSLHMLKFLLRSIRNHFKRAKLRQQKKNSYIVQEFPKSTIENEILSTETSWLKIKPKQSVFEKLS